MSRETTQGAVFFKNQARQFKTPQKKFIPEYERLNMEPKVELNSRKRAAAAPPILASSSGKRMVPRQVRVSSGASKEHAWIDGAFDHKGSLPPSARPNPQPKVEKTSPQPDISTGDFVVMYGGKILFVGKKEEAETFVWESLMYGNNKIGVDVDVEDIMVLERLSIKLGASFIK